MMKRLFSTLALLGVLVLAPSIGAVDFGADPDTLAAEKERWVERLQEKRDAVSNAKARKAAAQAEYTRMRAHNKARGDRRAQMLMELQSAEAAVAEAQEAYDEVLESARREGVPPGWLRDAGATGGPASPSGAR